MSTTPDLFEVIRRSSRTRLPTLLMPKVLPESWERWRTIDEDGRVMGWENAPRTNSSESDYNITQGQVRVIGQIPYYNGPKMMRKIE